MATYCIVEKVEGEFVDDVESVMKKEWPNASLVRIERVEDYAYATFHVKTQATRNAIHAGLHGMQGVSVLGTFKVGSERTLALGTSSSRVAVSLAAVWAGLFSISFFVPDGSTMPITASQLFVTQMAIALGIGAWIYLRHRRAMDMMGDRIDDVYVKAAEINERLRVIAREIRSS